MGPARRHAGYLLSLQPRRRFVILPNIEELPRVLPELYLRLTL